jgi:hypothetical protein
MVGSFGMHDWHENCYVFHRNLKRTHGRFTLDWKIVKMNRIGQYSLCLVRFDGQFEMHSSFVTVCEG